MALIQTDAFYFKVFLSLLTFKNWAFQLESESDAMSGIFCFFSFNLFFPWSLLSCSFFFLFRAKQSRRSSPLSSEIGLGKDKMDEKKRLHKSLMNIL